VQGSLQASRFSGYRRGDEHHCSRRRGPFMARRGEDLMVHDCRGKARREDRLTALSEPQKGSVSQLCREKSDRDAERKQTSESVRGEARIDRRANDSGEDRKVNDDERRPPEPREQLPHCGRDGVA